MISMPFLSRDIAPEQPILTVDIINKLPETLATKKPADGSAGLG